MLSNIKNITSLFKVFYFTTTVGEPRLYSTLRQDDTVTLFTFLGPPLLPPPSSMIGTPRHST